MGAVPSANYYESDIDLYPVNGMINDKLAQRHSYYENSKNNNNMDSKSTSQLSQHLKSSVPNMNYLNFNENTTSNNKKEPSMKKHKKLQRFFTFRQKCEDKNFLKSKSTHNFLRKSSSSSNSSRHNRRQTEHNVDRHQIDSSLDPSKNVMDESLGLVTSRSGSMSLLSSSYSIKSRMSNNLNKASTPNDAIQMEKSLINKEAEHKIHLNNTSCSSGCSSAASSSNLSRNSRLSHSIRQQHDSPLSSISTGYQSSSGNKNNDNDKIKNSKHLTNDESKNENELREFNFNNNFTCSKSKKIKNKWLSLKDVIPARNYGIFVGISKK
jgi:hypothetical protein